MTIVHEWGRDSNEVREEQILVVCLLDGNLREADKLGRMYPPFAKGKSAVEQFLGSIRTQLFLRLELVANRPFRASPVAWAAEVTGGLSGADMKGVLDALTDDQAARLLAVFFFPPSKMTHLIKSYLKSPHNWECKIRDTVEKRHIRRKANRKANKYPINSTYYIEDCSSKMQLSTI